MAGNAPMEAGMLRFVGLWATLLQALLPNSRVTLVTGGKTISFFKDENSEIHFSESPAVDGR